MRRPRRIVRDALGRFASVANGAAAGMAVEDSIAGLAAGALLGAGHASVRSKSTRSIRQPPGLAGRKATRVRVRRSKSRRPRRAGRKNPFRFGR